MLADPIPLLIDHAFLEKKAATNAMELLTRWPDDWLDGWVETMTAVARDEANHLAQVVRLLLARGGRMDRITRTRTPTGCGSSSAKATRRTARPAAGRGDDRGPVVRAIFGALRGVGGRRAVGILSIAIRLGVRTLHRLPQTGAAIHETVDGRGALAGDAGGGSSHPGRTRSPARVSIPGTQFTIAEAL